MLSWHVQVDTCKVSIGCEPEVTPEANDKPNANVVTASEHSKLAGDPPVCLQGCVMDITVWLLILRLSYLAATLQV